MDVNLNGAVFIGFVLLLYSNVISWIKLEKKREREREGEREES